MTGSSASKMLADHGRYDLVVVGGGAGGCAVAMRAAELGMVVALVELRDAGLGGGELHERAIQSRLLLRTSEVLHFVRHAGEFAIDCEGSAALDVAGLQRRRQSAISAIESNLRNQLVQRGVRLFFARGALAAERLVSVFDLGTGDERTQLLAGDIVLATGARQLPVSFPECEGVVSTVPDQIYNLRRAPRTALVLGASPTELEAVAALTAMGTAVTLLLGRDRLLPFVDEEAAAYLLFEMQKRGCTVVADVHTVSAQRTDRGICFVIHAGDGERTMLPDLVVGISEWQPRIQQLGLAKLGVQPEVQGGWMAIDERYRTAAPHLYAIGGCVGLPGWPELARAQGRHVAEVLAGRDPQPVLTDRLARTVATDPVLACTGMTRQQAREAGRDVAIGRGSLKFNTQGVVDGTVSGLVSIICERGTGEILGAHVAAPRAWELLWPLVLARGMEYSVLDLAEADAVQPSLGEVVSEAAHDAAQQVSF